MSTFEITRGQVLAGALALCASLGVSCQTPPGQVLVGTPQVFARERLLQERIDEYAWLESQLDEFEPGIQG